MPGRRDSVVKKAKRPSSGKEKSRGKKEKAFSKKRFDKAALRAEEDQVVFPGNVRRDIWIGMVETETKESVVAAGVQYIIDKALDGVYYKAIEEAAYPHTVEEASSSLLNILQMAFIRQDPGEPLPEENPQWAPDEEPVPPPIDAFARGALPVVKKEEAPPPAPSSKKPKRKKRVVTPVQADSNKPWEPAAISASSDARAPSASSMRGSVSSRTTMRLSRRTRGDAELASTVEEAPRKTMAEMIEEAKAERAAALQKAQEEEERERKRQAKILAELKGRNFTFDHKGQVLVVRKTDPDKLPEHTVVPEVVLDPPTKAPKGRGHQFGRSTTQRTVPAAGTKERRSRKTREQQLHAKAFVAAEPAAVQMQPDNMKMAQGVTLRKGDAGFAKSGGKRRPDPNHMSRAEYLEAVNARYSETVDLSALLGTDDTQSLPRIR